MNKAIWLLVGVVSWVMADQVSKEQNLALDGFVVQHIIESPSGEKSYPVRVERIRHGACKKVHATTEDVWSGNYVGKDVPDSCKKTFVTTVGNISPMVFDPEIKTVGELEVLWVLKQIAGGREDMVLVDGRKRHWHEQWAIPGSVSISFLDLDYDELFPEDFDRAMRLLGVKHGEKGLDFSKAKEATIYCNGKWCPQSRIFIQKLVDLGFPKKKLFWYRGGLEAWMLAGLTVVSPTKLGK